MIGVAPPDDEESDRIVAVVHGHAEVRDAAAGKPGDTVENDRLPFQSIDHRGQDGPRHDDEPRDVVLVGRKADGGGKAIRLRLRIEQERADEIGSEHGRRHAAETLGERRLIEPLDQLSSDAGKRGRDPSLLVHRNLRESATLDFGTQLDRAAMERLPRT